MWYTDLCQNHLTQKRRKTKLKELEASGKKNEFEWKYTGTTSYRSNGSKTIYDSRVEGGVIEVPPEAESPYTGDASDEKPWQTF